MEKERRGGDFSSLYSFLANRRQLNRQLLLYAKSFKLFSHKVQPVVNVNEGKFVDERHINLFQIFSDTQNIESPCQFSLENLLFNI